MADTGSWWVRLDTGTNPDEPKDDDMTNTARPHECGDRTLQDAREHALATTVTRRERQVLEALSGRRTNREIASELVIGVRTVETHVSSLLRKLWAEDRRHLESIVHDRERERLRKGPRRAVIVAAALVTLLFASCGSSATDEAEVADTPASLATEVPTATAPPDPDPAPTAAGPRQAEPDPEPEPTAAPEEAETAETVVDIEPVQCRNLEPCEAVLRAPSPLYDGAMVDIEIRGWTPSQTIGIAQCADPAAYDSGLVQLEAESGLPHGIFCDVRAFTRIRSGADGAIVWTYELRAGDRMAERTDAGITCDAEHPCILNVFASDALRFRDDEPRVVFPLDFG